MLRQLQRDFQLIGSGADERRLYRDIQRRNAWNHLKRVSVPLLIADAAISLCLPANEVRKWNTAGLALVLLASAVDGHRQWRRTQQQHHTSATANATPPAGGP